MIQIKQWMMGLHIGTHNNRVAEVQPKIWSFSISSLHFTPYAPKSKRQSYGGKLNGGKLKLPEFLSTVSFFSSLFVKNLHFFVICVYGFMMNEFVRTEFLCQSAVVSAFVRTEFMLNEFVSDFMSWVYTKSWVSSTAHIYILTVTYIQ